MFSFKKHSQKDKLIKRSKKRTIVIISVVLVFAISLSLILSFSLKYYPSPGYKYMKHEVSSRNVARSDKIQKRILKDGSEHVGVMFDARDDISDHAFYGTDSDATKKKEQKKAVKDTQKSQGWARYIEDSKKDKNDDETWYYVDTARGRGAHHYNTKGEAIDEFLVSNKDDNSLWIDNHDGHTNITVDIPVLKSPNEEDFDGIENDIKELPTVKFEFSLRENIPDAPDEGEGDGGDTTMQTSQTIEPAKKDKTSPGDNVLTFEYSGDTDGEGSTATGPTEVSTYDSLKTSWWYFEKMPDGSYQPQLIVYGLELDDSTTDDDGNTVINPTAGDAKLWEELEQEIWYTNQE